MLAKLMEPAPVSRPRDAAVVLVLDFVWRSRADADDRDRGHGLKAAERLVAAPILAASGGRVAVVRLPRLTASFENAVAALEAVGDIHLALQAPIEPALRRCPLRLRGALGLDASEAAGAFPPDSLVLSRAVVELLPGAWRERLGVTGSASGEGDGVAVGMGALKATG